MKFRVDYDMVNSSKDVRCQLLSEWFVIDYFISVVHWPERSPSIYLALNTCIYAFYCCVSSEPFSWNMGRIHRYCLM